jgi:hypothetical protein
LHKIAKVGTCKNLRKVKKTSQNPHPAVKPKRAKKNPCGALCEAGEGTGNPDPPRTVGTTTGSPDPPERQEMCGDEGLWCKSYVGVRGLFDCIFGFMRFEK